MITSAKQRKHNILHTSSMVKIGMLSGLGMVLMLLNFPLPIFPTFLKFDLSDAPAIIGTLSMGPLAGAMIQLLKNLLKIIIRSGTGGVGELASFLVGVAYVLPLGYIYQKWSSRRGVVIGSLLSIISMTITGGVLNYYIFIPAYSIVLGYPIDAFISMGASINSSIVDLRTLIMFSIVPFNFLKGVVVSFVGYGLFRVLQPLWKMY